ncbi:hypothetical protein [Streptomyces sp. NRRL S-495]|uniref:hypothetical protein n=1 Tax=Streptomyces sp. NRRL S-495 TaxID=1609133 RepID=UPI002570A20C|nr:hypothetical protein [Streptomyces sp. NRRL S-495]
MELYPRRSPKDDSFQQVRGPFALVQLDLAARLSGDPETTAGKTLADHRAERRAWVLDVLGDTAARTEPHRYLWEPVRPGDPDMAPLATRLLRAVAERVRWRAALDQALERAGGEPCPTTT